MVCLILIALCLAPALGMRSAPYVIGGKEATPNQFPYMAALQKGSDVLCGGAVVAEQWVVTSAHCAALKLDAVAVGLHDKTDETVGSPVFYTVMGYLRHASYVDDVSIGSPYDIGLIKLGEKAPAANIIGLAGEGATSNCAVMGWGHTEGGVFPKPLPNILHYADVSIYSQDFCKGRWSQGQILDSHLCAGVDGKVVGCTNDRGGPLVCDVAGEKKLVGIMSFSTFSCGTGTPAVYTRMSSYRDWLSDNTCDKV